MIFKLFQSLKKRLGEPVYRKYFLLGAGLSMAVFNFTFQLSQRALWSGGEARAAEIAKEMIERRDYLMPHLNGEVVLTKPVLFHWLIVASSSVFGFNELAVRLPAALSGLGSVLLTYLLGKELFGWKTGLGAAAMLATSIDFIWNARSAKIDNLVVLLLCASVFFFYRGYKYPAGRRGLNYAMSYFVMGLGALAKGPFGFAPAMVIIACFLAASKKWGAFAQFFKLRFIAVLLAVALPWYAFMFFKLGGFSFAYDYFFGQQVALYLGVETLSPEPVWWYLPHLMLGFLPWSLFFPAALILAIKEIRRGKQEGLILSLLWFGILLVMFSSGGKKSVRYILPIYPALALITSQLWHSVANEDIRTKARSYIRISFLSLLVLQAFVTVLLLFSLPISQWITSPGIASNFTETDLFAFNHLKVFFAANRLFFAFVSLTLLAIMVFAYILTTKSRYALSLASVAAAIIFYNSIYILKVVPVVDSFHSPKPFAQMLKQKVPPGAVLIAYPGIMDQIRYYLGRNVDVYRDAAKFEEALASNKQEVYGVIFERDLKKIKNIIDGRYFIRDDSYNIDFRRVYFISNRER